MTTTSTRETPAVVERAAQPYAAIRRQVTMAQMDEVLPPLNDQVFDWLSAHGGQPAGPPFWRYRVIDMANLLDIEVGVTTTDLARARRRDRHRHRSRPAGTRRSSTPAIPTR